MNHRSKIKVTKIDGEWVVIRPDGLSFFGSFEEAWDWVPVYVSRAKLELSSRYGRV